MRFCACIRGVDKGTKGGANPDLPTKPDVPQSRCQRILADKIYRIGWKTKKQVAVIIKVPTVDGNLSADGGCLVKLPSLALMVYCKFADKLSKFADKPNLWWVLHPLLATPLACICVFARVGVRRCLCWCFCVTLLVQSMSVINWWTRLYEWFLLPIGIACAMQQLRMRNTELLVPEALQMSQLG